tara:strand:- start:794 stop:1258 length:465 start_codon:yes stop_codon:yes gene_type:complete
MELEVLRFSSQIDSTNGLLFENTKSGKVFLAYTLEDEFRQIKEYGETRIPDGEYELGLRTIGGFNSRYSERFSDIHKGMLQVMNVEGFEYILIHCGNSDEDTSGCLLVGDSQISNLVEPNGFIGNSSDAYKRIYPSIADAIINGEKVIIKYKTT